MTYGITVFHMTHQASIYQLGQRVIGEGYHQAKIVNRQGHVLM